MKRSQINRQERETLDFLRACRFALPEWATWRPADWAEAGPALGEVKARMLGWDIGDFGSGDFARLGHVIFTLRNGPRDHSGEPYCEKVIIMRDGQNLPIHFHFKKIEDIIVRSGGELVIRAWNSDREGRRRTDPVKVLEDGALWKEFAAGEEIKIRPGGCITLTPGIYHSFQTRGDALIGEVSSVNDDVADNRFLDNVTRFIPIEEDEEILYYLCNEYP